MEYLVRPAKITDIDRVVTLCDGALAAARGGSDRRPADQGDLFRQLVDRPHATFLVAEARREIAGVVVLALRPSVRAGGNVGTIDLLVVDPRFPAEEVTQMLIVEALRSASNKACTLVEAGMPEDDAPHGPWDRFGFRQSGPLIARSLGRGERIEADGSGTGSRG